MGIENVISTDTSRQTFGGSHIKVLLLLRQDVEHQEFIETLKALDGVDVRVFYRPKTLTASMLRTKESPEILLLDADITNPDDVGLIGELKGEGIPVVALAERNAELAALKAMRAGADDVLLKPIDPSEAREVFARMAGRSIRSRPVGVGTAMVFMHSAGGAGATTLAVNTACILASGPGSPRVCLLDFDIQFGNAADLLDLPAISAIRDIVDEPSRLDHEVLERMMVRHSSGIWVLTAPRVPLPLSAYTSEVVRAILGLAKQSFEYVVIDLPVALETWTDAVLREASIIYAVSLPTVPAIHRLSQELGLLRDEDLGHLPLKVVINRFQKLNREPDVPTNQIAKAIGRNVDYQIPNDYKLVGRSHNQGKSAVQIGPHSMFSERLKDMLSDSLGRTTESSRRRWPSFFGRG